MSELATIAGLKPLHQEPPGFTALQRHYFHYRWQQVRNVFARLDTSGRVKAAAIAFGGGTFVVFAALFFYRLLSMIMGQEDLGDLRIVLMVRLLNLVTMLFLLMLVYSNMVAAISTVYLGRDLQLLMNTPLPTSLLFRTKLMEVFMNSSWMLMVFGIPIFGAYGAAFGAPAVYYPVMILGLFLFLLIPLGIGVSGVIVLVRFFPVKQMQQFMVLAGLFFSIGLVILLVLMKPQELVNPVGAELLTQYLQDMRIPTMSFLPSAWLTELYMSAIDSEPATMLRYLALLAVGAGAIVALTLLLGELYFYDTWTEAQDHGSSSQQGDGALLRGFMALLRPWASPMACHLVEKDLKSFFREPRQWSQLFILGALMVIYIYNLAQLPFALFFYPRMMSYLALGAVGFIMATIAGRFAFPSVSMEGRAFWLLQSSPLGFRGYLLERYLFYALPSLVFALGLMFASNRIIEVSSDLMVVTMVATALLTLSIFAIGTGLGARYLRFDTGNPAEMLVSMGGFWFMLWSIGLTMATLVLLSLPEVFRFFPQVYRYTARFGIGDYVAAYCAATALLVAAGAGHLYLGMRALERQGS